MIRLASHNTMTYLPPTKWWMRLLKPIYKCQDLTIQEQYNKGVRVFDIRIRYDFADYKWKFAHGIVFLKGEVTEVFDLLNACKDCCIRIVLESNNDNILQSEFFKSLLCKLVVDYPNIYFFEGTRKYDWFKLGNNIVKTNLPYVQRISSMDGKWYNFWCPRLYAWMNNKKVLFDKSIDYNNYIFVDFIGKYFK